MPFQHDNSIIHGHIYLGPNRDQALGQVVVVLQEEPNGYHEESDVVEDQRMFSDIGFFLLKKSDWVFTPVAERIKVMRSVVPIIIAEAVTL